MKCVRDNPVEFPLRKSLPEGWAGKSGEELEKVTGVKGAVFCHRGLFTAVAETKEAITKMAEIAVNS